MAINMATTQAVQRRYNRIAPIYDLVNGMMERRFKVFLPRAWSLIQGDRILEVGVGTGRNIQYHPAEAQVTAIDFSDRMLARARERLAKLGRSADLRHMDAQAMSFPDDSFDSAVATCVFCSVPDPVMGLREVKRVVKPGGSIILIEHGRTKSAFINRILDWLDPLTSRMWGAHVNRDTLDNLRRAGLEIEHVERVDSMCMFKLIVARA
jgi:ubiquinone/menaquinone biosynthesis C-methylase UbiE